MSATWQPFRDEHGIPHERGCTWAAWRESINQALGRFPLVETPDEGGDTVWSCLICGQTSRSAAVVKPPAAKPRTSEQRQVDAAVAKLEKAGIKPTDREIGLKVHRDERTIREWRLTGKIS